MGADSSPTREWMPHLWQGCSLVAWLRLLLRNRFAVCTPYYFCLAVIITFASIFHEVLRLLQDAWLGDRANRAPIPHEPLFIIGHWRTGTTLLHELLVLDDRHTSPNNYQCLAPHHFLLTERLFKRLFWFFMPTHRPMDNMPIGWDRPQEDEFALCMLGAPSPYTTIAFPNHPPQDQDAFDLERLPPRERRSWREKFLRFLRQLAFKDPRRLVLKSPTHSCRINTLLQLFPNARFVHIVRDPYVVFPSTVNLWKTLYRTHGLQAPTFAGLEDHVFQTFVHLYDRIEAGKPLVPPGRFHELRYEDLIADPEEELRRLYERLELGGFEDVLPRLRKYLADNAGYQTNRYKPLDRALQAEISRRWGKVIRQYGYSRENAECGMRNAE
jgi:hypothetical protein